MDTDPDVRTMTIPYVLNSGIDDTSTLVTIYITSFKNPISTALMSGF